MKDPNAPNSLPSEISNRLEEVLQRDLKIRWLNGIIRGLAFAFAIMITAMIIDLMIGWLSPGARWLMTLGSLGTVLTGFGLWLIIPLLRRPNTIDIAQTIDKKNPDLEERWSTVAELSNNQDPAAVRGSEAMIDAVKDEAQKLNYHINAEKIIPDAPIRMATKWLAGVAAILLAFVAWDYPQARVLLTRFWLPSSDASLTQIDVLTKAQKVPIREALSLEAQITGRIHEDATFVTLRESSGEETIHIMELKESDEANFTFPINSVKESFDFRIRSGDDQTEWQSVTAVSRPKITEIQLGIQPPSYSELPPKNLTSLPHRLRILQGSLVDLRFKADQPLKELRLDIEDQEPRALELSADGWYQFADQPEESIAFKTILRNEHNLENKTKPSSRFIVYQDLPPAVRVLDPTKDIAKKSEDTVLIDFEATDDFGIKSAQLIVSQIDADGNKSLTELPIDLEEEAGDKAIRKEIELDLSQFDLKQGDQLSYVVSVTDTKEGESTSESASSESDPDQENAEQNELANSEQQEPASELPDPNESDPSSSSSQMASQSKPQEKSSDQKQLTSQPPPSNDMAKRMLDAGQSSACKPRNITIDEWAGEFDGDDNEKLQLAIDPVLQRLKALLNQAHDTVETAQNSFQELEKLTETDLEIIAEGKDLLRQSNSAIAELTAKSNGTPYAFMGLQLQNIGTNHIDPANEALSAISTNETEQTEVHLKSGRFHIERALAMLNDLEKSYEEVKREEKIADAMQRLAKMHQLFLENTQKMLGSKKPVLNSYDRKIAEVDDEFVEELKKLLEEKKKIMDELAKLLEEDPRMLRRYLAMMQLQGTSQRDQMTLLAQRQRELKTQVQTWTETNDEARPALTKALLGQYSLKLEDSLQGSTQMHENMETWLPLVVDPAHSAITPIIDETQSLIETLGRSMSEMAADQTEAGIELANSALSKLRSLHEQLPLLSDEITDAPKIDIYIANRLEEVEKLISTHSGWIRVMTALNEGDFAKTAEVVQHTLAQDTATLSDKIVITKDQVSSMSEEIRETAEELVRIVQTDILYTQSVVTGNLRDGDFESAAPMESHLVTAYSLAESSFDRLLNLIIAKLDEAPAPSGAGANKSLEDVLAMLENEMKAQEGLGIPCRPINVSIMKDWMSPGSGSMPGSGMAQAQARAAQAQGKAAQKETDRLQKEANAAAKALQAKLNKGQGAGSGKSGAPGPAAPKKSWNVLVSQLDKDILQGRDNVPPEKYRDAINAYFQTIAEKVPTTTK